MVVTRILKTPKYSNWFHIFFTRFKAIIGRMPGRVKCQVWRQRPAPIVTRRMLLKTTKRLSIMRSASQFKRCTKAESKLKSFPIYATFLGIHKHPHSLSVCLSLYISGVRILAFRCFIVKFLFRKHLHIYSLHFFCFLCVFLEFIIGLLN